MALEARLSHGIEVDVCPNCKGIWLDRGELERLLGAAEPVRSAVPPPPGSDMNQFDRRPLADSAPAPARSQSDSWSSDHRSGSKSDGEGKDGKGGKKDGKKKKKRKKGWADRLEDVLDDVLDF